MGPTTVLQLVPVQGGRLMFKTTDGTAVLGDKDFPSSEVALAALREVAGQHGLEMAVYFSPDGRVDRVEVGKELRRRPEVTVTLVMSAELNDLLDGLAHRLGESKVGVVARGAALLKLAADLREEKKRLAILGPDRTVEGEVVGYLPGHDG